MHPGQLRLGGFLPGRCVPSGGAEVYVLDLAGNQSTRTHIRLDSLADLSDALRQHGA